MDEEMELRLKTGKKMKKKKLPQRGTANLTEKEAIARAMEKHKVALAYLKNH